MFTGIVTDVGTVSDIAGNEGRRIRLNAPRLNQRLEPGASIACDGVCLTAVGSEIGELPWFDVDASVETLSKTNISSWHVGTRVNLERPLRVGDELGGHIVAGHIDGVAEIAGIEQEGESWRIRLRSTQELAQFIAPKGSVALNGVSLTVNEVEGDIFGVNLIPFTLDKTNWRDAKIGSFVNMEADLIARYVSRMRRMEN